MKGWFREQGRQDLRRPAGGYRWRCPGGAGGVCAPGPATPGPGYRYDRLRHLQPAPGQLVRRQLPDPVPAGKPV